MKKYHEFLQLGYLSQDSKLHEYSKGFNENIIEMNEVELLNKGFNLFNSNMEKTLEKQNAIVPISGGLDSRLILSSVLESKNADEINTITFGTPGSLDYEIGNKIAKKLGTKHTSINIKKLEFEISELYNFATEIENPVVMFHNLPKKIFDYGDNSVLLSGYLGDVISGKRLDYEEAKSWYKEKYNYFKWMTNRHSFKVSNECLLNELAEINEYQNVDNLTKKEVIFIKEHNEKLNRYQVMGNIKNLETPFFNTEFMNFLISLPKELRRDQKYYKDLIFKKYKNGLTEIPVKNFYGSKFSSSTLIKNFNRNKHAIFNRLSKKINFVTNPYVNYIDFNFKLKNDYKFKHLILELLNSLKVREIGTYQHECVRLIREINENKVKNPYDFLLLASLEIYIRVERIKL